MKLNVVFPTLACLLNLFGNLQAQNATELTARPVPICGTTENLQRVFLNDREVERTYFDAQHIPEHKIVGQGIDAQQQFILPVVFHIIHDFGAENISDAQVFDALRILNEDFRKDNADTTLIDPDFIGVSADSRIQFQLASIDPNGNCTNGIERIASTRTYFADDLAKLNYWPRSKYINIWVVQSLANGAAAYAYLPGTSPMAVFDGIIVRASHVGSIGIANASTSRTLTHEMGHFLNLWHTWGLNNGPGVICGDDNVADTPDTQGWTICELANNDVCTGGVRENVQNFMEYSYCFLMFTEGQCERMRQALFNPLGQRDQLLINAPFLLADQFLLCAPIADFLPSDHVQICAGQYINFQDASWNGIPLQWSWSFSGGTPATSTNSAQLVQYLNPGIHAVSLTSTNVSGSSSKTRTAAVVVFPAQANYHTSYTEGFEDTTHLQSEWHTDSINESDNEFVITDIAASSGMYSVMVANGPWMMNEYAEMIMPPVDLASMSSPVFNFKVAFGRNVYPCIDSLFVYASIDCGQTWIKRYSRYGNNLATTMPYQPNFVPTSFEWRLENVSLNASITSSSHVLFKFKFVGKGGSNLYIDDINIASPSGVIPFSTSSSFSISPNPTSENIGLNIELAQKQDVTIELLTISGTQVAVFKAEEMEAGNHAIILWAEQMPRSGVYFVRLITSDGTITTQKLVVL
jgi:PKD repeat protein